MNKDYRFTSDEEPTDEQLENLMLAVLEDVKKRLRLFKPNTKHGYKKPLPMLMRKPL